MEESTGAPLRKKRLRRAPNICRQPRFKLSMRRRREPTRSNGLPRIWASHRSQRHPSPEYLTTRRSFRRKRQERLIVLPPIVRLIAAELSRGTITTQRLRPTPRRVQRLRLRAQTTMPLDPAGRLILANFRLLRGPALQTRATQRRTRNTSSSRKRYSQSRNRNGKSCSSGRIRNTSD